MRTTTVSAASLPPLSARSLRRAWSHGATLGATSAWLTVGPVGQEDFGIVLMAIPGPPVFEEEMRRQVLDLTEKSAAGTMFRTTDDCRASYEEL
jgi:hypothetical protein